MKIIKLNLLALRNKQVNGSVVWCYRTNFRAATDFAFSLVTSLLVRD